MDVLITYDYGKERINKFENLGYNVILKREKGLEYSDELEDVEILVCYNPFETLDIDKLKNLKWIQLSSVGIDQLPKDKLEKRDILVTNNKGGYSKPMGEWIVLNILEIIKRKKVILKNQLNNKWDLVKNLTEIVDKKILFLGTGTIATEGAKRLQGFECKIDGVNRKGDSKKYFKKVYSVNNLMDIVKDYDVIISTLPSTDKTYHFIDNDFFDQMKDLSIFINISRGDVVDQDALIKNIKKGKFKGVALDVFESEPLDENSELWNFENVYISSHNSWISDRKDDRRFEIIYENLKRFKENNELKNIVSVKRGY
ncbi:MAG: phosphoglycerate dehydrogenase [Bacillota bacterium]